MTTQPLMPKATAVWLVENTALTFDQIADFCKLHPLEVRSIADGDAAQGIKGLDPIQSGQLTREEIADAEAHPEAEAVIGVVKRGIVTPNRRSPDVHRVIYWNINHLRVRGLDNDSLLSTLVLGCDRLLRG